MSVLGNKLIKRVEKQLATFRSYSFNNYSRLMLILVNYKSFLENDIILKCRQAQTDLLFEVQEEIEALHGIRYEANKHGVFKSHVETALIITRKIDNYLPVIHTERKPQRTLVLDVLKRYFITSLRHT